jgi:hypothetical protein
MYAHQVIEDLRWFGHGKSDIALISNAIKFHFGDTCNLWDVFFPKMNPLLFAGENKICKIPYETCLFEYAISSNDDFNKASILVHQNAETIILRTHLYDIGFKKFVVFPVTILVNMGRSESEDWYKKVFTGDPTDPDYDKEAIEEWVKWIGTAVNMSLLLLDCKNIATEKVHPPEKLNRKRRMLKKQPLFTYHTLVIKPTGKRQESIPKHLWENRIHLCRGHFKTYTKEKPLFGHITGRYWWQPSVRGRNREGIVMKDYQVQTA